MHPQGVLSAAPPTMPAAYSYLANNTAPFDVRGINNSGIIAHIYSY